MQKWRKHHYQCWVFSEEGTGNLKVWHTHNFWFSVGRNSCFPEHVFLSLFGSRRQDKDSDSFCWRNDILFCGHSPIPPPPFFTNNLIEPLSLRLPRMKVAVSHNLVLLVYSVAAFYHCKLKHTERALKWTIPVRNICSYLYLNVFVEA